MNILLQLFLEGPYMDNPRSNLEQKPVPSTSSKGA
jgi:hypothetical protein